MKTRLVCLILGLAFTGAAFAQSAVSGANTSVTFDCPEDECHVLPWYRGEGGFIGRILPGIDEVTYYAVCGDMSLSQGLTPDDGGIVSTLFNRNNGVACERNDGELQIHGLMDGGWYWITDEENTAVSFLLPTGVLTNRKITPANPGWPGLTFTASEDGSVSFVKEVASGRVGILPHILPLPGEPEPPRCGQYKESDEDGADTLQRVDDCLLDAVYSVRVTMGLGDNAITGGQIFRPVSGTTPLTLGLYGTGHLDLGVSPWGAGFDNPLRATWEVTAQIEGEPGFPRPIDDSSGRVWGVVADPATGALTVHNPTDSDDACTEDIGYTVTLEIKANAATGTNANAVLPPVPGDTQAGDFRPSTMLRIRCPGGAAAASGRELVPGGLLSGETERDGA